MTREYTRRDAEALITHADGRAVECPTCQARPGDPCVTVGAPVMGRPMELHHRARYTLVRARRRR